MKWPLSYQTRELKSSGLLLLGLVLLVCIVALLLRGLCGCQHAQLVSGSAERFQLKVKNPWYAAISNGSKKVEARLSRGVFTKDRRPEPGACIEILRTGAVPKESINATVIKNIDYPSFKELLNAEGLDNVLPGIASLDEGLKVYQTFYTVDDEKAWGVVAIRLRIEEADTPSEADVVPP